VTSTHPSPELLVPYALGAEDLATARHVEGCPTCRREIEQLQETAGLLRGPAVLEHRTETPDCLDELVVADFVDGRLGPDARAPVVAHLLTCARCRSVVKATSRHFAETSVTDQTPARRWRRWSIPLGLAAAAALVLLLLPRRDDDGSSSRRPEPPVRGPAAPVPINPAITSTVRPAPISPAPGAFVTRVDRLLWSSVPGAEQYRLRLYNDEGDMLWTAETADTLVILPDSVGLSPRATYFWRVEAQTEWRRWVASDLVEFRLVGPLR
jgi:hypothetical protein